MSGKGASDHTRESSGEEKERMDGQDVDLSNYTIPLDTPVSRLDASQAFKGLSTKEKLYCHYLCRAAWEGSSICLLQTSPESVPVYLLLKELFSRESVTSLREATSKQSVSDDQFKVRRIS